MDRLAYGGQGVARLDDFVIFVRGALPGDRVRGRIGRRRRSHADARTLEVLEPSPLRVPRACAHDDCGGCEWQALTYDAQLRFKQEQVVESLAHIAGLRAGEPDGYLLEPILGMDEPWSYRNKMEYSFAEHDGQLVLGLHRRGSWREIVETDDCRLAAAPIVAARRAVIEACRALGLRAYRRDGGDGLLRHLVVRHGSASGDLVVNLFVRRRFAEEQELMRRLTAACGATSVAVTVNEAPADAAVGGPPQLLYGPPYFRETLAGVPLRVPLAAFLQTNSRMCDGLYETALRFAEPQADQTAFDLYCGIGALTVLLARRSLRVHAIEVQPEAVQAAAENARLNHVGNIAFYTGDVRRVLKQPPEDVRPGLVVVDPPRAGLSPKALMRSAALGAARFVYVSCNPTTLAGDAMRLQELGYRLSRVAPVDMFPHTHHIETVALFLRRT